MRVEHWNPTGVKRELVCEQLVNNRVLVCAMRWLGVAGEHGGDSELAYSCIFISSDIFNEGEGVETFMDDV